MPAATFEADTGPCDQRCVVGGRASAWHVKSCRNSLSNPRRILLPSLEQSARESDPGPGAHCVPAENQKSCRRSQPRRSVPKSRSRPSEPRDHESWGYPAGVSVRRVSGCRLSEPVKPGNASYAGLPGAKQGTAPRPLQVIQCRQSEHHQHRKHCPDIAPADTPFAERRIDRFDHTKHKIKTSILASLSDQASITEGKVSKEHPSYPADRLREVLRGP